jgi:serine/threonine protein kinase/CRP-like cAMP-binding protein
MEDDINDSDDANEEVTELFDWCDESDHDHKENSLIETSDTRTEQVLRPDSNSGGTATQLNHLSDRERELELQLNEVQDLRFNSLDSDLKNTLLKSLELREYNKDDIIVAQGDNPGGFYFILGPSTAEVEVVKRNKDGTDKLLTRLRKGQYFGEKFFVSRREAKRTATIRAISFSKLAFVAPDQFLKWSNFRLFLLLKTVPLVQTLPMIEQVEMYSLFQHEEYAEGDYIIRQGEIGDKFYIILEGSAFIKEEHSSGDPNKARVITTLYDGHFFGEMALIYDEPRMASVVAAEKISCLAISKANFRDALNAPQFKKKMQEQTYEIMLRREKRKMAATQLAHQKSGGSTSSSVTEIDTPRTLMSNKVVKRRVNGAGRYINNYHILGELGKGSYGCVYLVRNEDTGKDYAMKTLLRSTNKWKNLSISDEIKAEIEIMKGLRHENIVSLIEVIDDPNSKEVYLIQELMELGAVLPNEAVSVPIAVDQARYYFRDMLRGVRYLHSKGIIHRDLKPQNMLRSSDDRVKIADFGAAVITNGLNADGRGAITAGGTPAFMAPEIYKYVRNSTNADNSPDYVNSPKVDVWSLGATLYNMVVGQPPWMANTQLELASTVQTIELTYPDDCQYINPHLKNLLKRMLDKDPATRISMDDVYIHDWVTAEGSEMLDDDSARSDRSSNMSHSRSGSAISSSYSDSRSSFSKSSGHFGPGVRYIGTSFVGPHITQGLGHRHPAQKSDSDSTSNHSGQDSRSSRSSKAAHPTVMLLGDDGDLALEDLVHVKEKYHSLESPPVEALFLPSKQFWNAKDNKRDTSEIHNHQIESGNAESDALKSRQNDLPKKLTRTKLFKMTSTDVIGPKGEVRKALKFTMPSQHDKPMQRSMSGLDVRRGSVLSNNEFDDDDDNDEHDIFSLEEETSDPRRNSFVRRGLDSDDSFFEASGSPLSGDLKPASSSNSEIQPLTAWALNNLDHKGPIITKSSSSRSLKGAAETFLSQQKHKMFRHSDRDLKRSLSVKSTSKEYYRTISSSDELDQEISHYSGSDDEVIQLDDVEIDDLFEDLGKKSLNSEMDLQFAPMLLNEKNIRKLYAVKTWAGQMNRCLNFKYGLAENIIGRHTMEDRTTAIPSMESLHDREVYKSIKVQTPEILKYPACAASRSQSEEESSVRRDNLKASPSPNFMKDFDFKTSELTTVSTLTGRPISSAKTSMSECSDGKIGYVSDWTASSRGSSFSSLDLDDIVVENATISADSEAEGHSISPPKISLSVPYKHPDFGFFGVFDGHGGAFTAETLQTSLHLIFERRLSINYRDFMKKCKLDVFHVDDYISRSLVEAFAILDRDILTIEYERASELNELRAALRDAEPMTSPVAPWNKFGFLGQSEEPLSNSKRVSRAPCLMRSAKQKNTSQSEDVTYSGSKIKYFCDLICCGFHAYI